MKASLVVNISGNPLFGRGCTSPEDMMAGLTCRDMRDEVQPRPNTLIETIFKNSMMQ